MKKRLHEDSTETPTVEGAEPYRLQAVSDALPWTLWDANDIATWDVPPLEWLVEGIIQRNALGFLSGPPKVGKSFFALDLCDSITRGGQWLGKYRCEPANVLYIAREDPPRRVRDRLKEITSSRSGKRKGCFRLVIKEKVNLLDSGDIDQLKSVIRRYKIDLVVLDVVNRMIPGLDENDAAGVGRLVDAMEELQRTLGVAVLAVDHTRKASGDAKVGPFELKGSIAKYGCCDFIICVGRRSRDLEAYFQNKDVDHATRLLLDVSPKGSTGPKFTWKEQLDAATPDQKEKGDRNRKKVVEAVGDEWVSRQQVMRKTDLVASTVTKHLSALCQNGEIQKRGSNKATQYRRNAEAVTSKRPAERPARKAVFRRRSVGSKRRISKS